MTHASPDPVAADPVPLRAPDAAGLREAVLRHLQFSIGKDPEHAQVRDWRVALSLAIRDQVVEPWFRSTRATYARRSKRVYYLSMEFLIGRLLGDAMLNLGVTDAAREAMTALGVDFDAAVYDEPDPALGNGGLGRLAACFLDSLSTIGCPAYGYGIRYEHGLFRQGFVDGEQIEEPEDWLSTGNVWEFERPEAAFDIGFGGTVVEKGGRAVWTPDEKVHATAYDTPIIGFRGRWANTLRLWSARPVHGFDLARFNRGEYVAASEAEALARTISRVLYPDDTTDAGKRLRLQQEYMFTSASLHDVLRRFESECGDLRQLPARAAIQLNDTHPAIAAPELVRLLVDERGLAFDEAADIACACLSYTNHTLLPEALERWPVALLGDLLPRHVQLIERIDERHRKAHTGTGVRIVQDGDVSMGDLAFVMAHRVNGVSALHTELMKKTVFAELHALHPDRIVNETNGVTPRRWVLGCNPGLADLATSVVGPDWPVDLERLEGLASRVDDRGFLDAYAEVKRSNKGALADWVARTHGAKISPDALFDVQIKRIHEYKRQLLNILEAVALWLRMRDEPNAEWTPRVKLFAGKAAPGYLRAKEIIHLINRVAATINADPRTKDLLQIVFLPNYNVTLAERMIPASDLSEQISTAGKEASGTGNMKFALNGALTIGTLDGANVEIRERVGPENFYLFGLDADGVVERRESTPDHAARAIAASDDLRAAVETIESGLFQRSNPGRFEAITNDLRHADYFLVCADFDSYYAAQRSVDEGFRDRDDWTRRALLNTARTGWFSSDRTIRGYMEDVWSAGSALDEAGTEAME